MVVNRRRTVHHCFRILGVGPKLSAVSISGYSTLCSRKRHSRECLSHHTLLLLLQVPDIYDSAKYDAIHNRELGLGLQALYEARMTDS